VSHLRPLSGKEMMVGWEKRIAREEGRPNPIFRVLALEAGAGALSRANRMRNPDWRVNQRGYVSAANLPPQQYGPDGWCASGLVNLCTNPSAETNTTSWSTGNCTVTTNGGWSASGAQSFRVSAPSSNDSYILYTLPTVPGLTYTLSAVGFTFTALTGTAHARARAIYVQGNSIQLGLSAAMPNVADTPTRVTVSFVANSTTATVRLYHGHTGGVMYWDAVMMLEGDWTANLPTYFDGSIAGSMWTGTAHGSTSYNITAVGSITLPAAPQGGLATLSSGMRVFQVLDRTDVAAGDWLFNQPGTAKGRVYNAGTALGARPAFAEFPILFEADGTDDVLVEAWADGGTATLGEVQFIPGSTELPYLPRLLAEEMVLCLRTCYQHTAPAANTAFLTIFYATTTAVVGKLDLPVEMRAVPVLTTSTIASMQLRSGNSLTPSAIALNGGCTSKVATVDITSAAGTAGQGGVLRSLAAGHYIRLEAENWKFAA
jgi:hypothetical protein